MRILREMPTEIPASGVSRIPSHRLLLEEYIHVDEDSTYASLLEDASSAEEDRTSTEEEETAEEEDRASTEDDEAATEEDWASTEEDETAAEDSA